MPGAKGWLVSLSASSGGLHQRTAEHAFDLAARHAAGPQQHRRVETSDNGGFDADRDRAAVDDQIDPPGEIALHMRRRGRRDVARQIGRRRHHRSAERAQDRPRHRMRGHPDRDGIETCGGEIGNRAVLGFGQHQRQRPRPERFGQRDRLARRSARSAARRARSPTWAISGLNEGRPLACIEPRDRRRHWWHRRRGHRRSRSGTRPARRRQGTRGRRPRRPRRRAKSAFSGPHSRG